MNPFKSLLDLFLPRECHVCGSRLLDCEDFVCAPCIERLPVTGYEKYWHNKTAPNSDLNPMEQRFAGQIPLQRACAPFFYTRDSALASLVHDFKYRNFPRLASVLGGIGARGLIESGFFEGVDLLLPVPLHWSKRLRRGYNQSELIAMGVSEATGIPVAKNLKASRPHRTQTALSSEQRIANTRGIFTVDSPAALSGKTVMLVDDICTTGATLLSASEAVVKAAPGVAIRIFTLGVV